MTKFIKYCSFLLLVSCGPGLGIDASDDNFSSTGYSLSYPSSTIVFINGANNPAYNPTFSVNNEADYQFSVSPSLPSGLSINQQTGGISGIPVGLTSATYTITLTASHNLIQYNLFIDVQNGYLVNDASDLGANGVTTDNNCTTINGTCTLRAAIEESEGTAGNQVIVVPNYTISFGTSISITTPVAIYGYGQDATILDANNSTRHFFINVGTAGAVEMKRMNLRNGSSGTAGGSMTIATGAATSFVMEELTFLSNQTTSAVSGGAIAVSGGATTLNLSKSTFNGNSSSGSGGAINIAAGAAANISQSYFYGNSANSFGGAIQDLSAGVVTINESLFESNVTASNGGAMRHQSGTTSIISNTFYKNQGSQGGAVSADGSGTINMYRNTIYNNTATTAAKGGGVYVNGATVNIANNIFALNVAASVDNCQVDSGTLTSSNNNLSDTVSGDCNTSMGQDQNSTNPLLGALQNNGGSTKSFLPAINSPVIDQGNSAFCNNDQRGVASPVDATNVSDSGNGNCDIGSIEIQSSDYPSLF